ncbi:MAG: DUF599 domain-containing protein [Thiotrichaceae bacterium]|nr:DUF599 domain-containing protein [Thiotrichaceae bacterium]
MSDDLEINVSLIAIGLLVVYHLIFLTVVRYKPLCTAIGRTNYMRAIWVEFVTTQQKDILAVQTVRNWTMAATFLASTSIVIGLGIVNFALTTGKSIGNTPYLSFISHDPPGIWHLKLLLLAFDFFFAFFNFTLTIRYYNHASFQLNIPLGIQSLQSIINVVKFGANYYTLGMRCYYISIPLSLWLFGGFWFLLGTLLLILVLYRLDRPFEELELPLRSPYGQFNETP